MKKLIILFIFLTITTSCNYKLASPYNSDNQDDSNNDKNKSIIMVDSNITVSENDIINAIDNNKKQLGKNILFVKGYINKDNNFLDNLAKVLKQGSYSDVTLDFSETYFDPANTKTLENVNVVITIKMGMAENLPANFFNGCTALANLYLPSTLKSIDRTAFQGTSIENIQYFGTSPDTLKDSKCFELASSKPKNLYLPNVTTTDNEKWNNFLGTPWGKIFFGTSLLLE